MDDDEDDGGGNGGDDGGSGGDNGDFFFVLPSCMFHFPLLFRFLLPMTMTMTDAVHYIADRDTIDEYV